MAVLFVDIQAAYYEVSRRLIFQGEELSGELSPLPDHGIWSVWWSISAPLEHLSFWGFHRMSGLCFVTASSSPTGSWRVHEMCTSPREVRGLAMALQISSLVLFSPLHYTAYQGRVRAGWHSAAGCRQLYRGYG